jgi:hypothetical protein
MQFKVNSPKRAGEIKLRSNLARRAYRADVRYTPARNNRLPFKHMLVGDSTFLPGYTTDQRKEPDLRQVNMSVYTENKSVVWTVRSTVEQGVRGVRVFRVA